MTHLWESDLNLLGRFHVEWTKSCTETPPVVTLRSDAIFVGRPHHVGILVGAYSTGDADHFRPSDKKVMLLSIHAPRWMGGPEISFIFEDFNALWGNIPYTRGSSSLPLSRLQIWFLTGWIWPFFDNDIPNGCSHMISKGSPRTRRCVNRIWCGGGWPSQHPANTQGLRWWTLPFWRYRFQWDFWMMNKHSVWRCQYYQLSSHGNPVL